MGVAEGGLLCLWGYLKPRMKISVITDISVLRFYGYIGYIGYIGDIFGYIGDISVDILEKIIDRRKIDENL